MKSRQSEAYKLYSEDEEKVYETPFQATHAHDTFALAANAMTNYPQRHPAITTEIMHLAMTQMPYWAQGQKNFDDMVRALSVAFTYAELRDSGEDITDE